MTRLTKVLCFIGLTIAMFMGTLDTTIVNIAIPKIMTELHGSLANTSRVMTIYTLAMSVFMITASKIADRYGRKKIMLLGLALFGGFSAACMTASLATRTHYIPLFSRSWRSHHHANRVTDGHRSYGKRKNQSGRCVGRCCHCAGSCRRTAHWWHHFTNSFLAVDFWDYIPLAILAFLLVTVCAKESYDESLARRIDLPGLLLLTAALGGVTFGLLEGRQYGGLHH